MEVVTRRAEDAVVNGNGDVHQQRQHVDFHPSVWGEFFINNPPPVDPYSDSWLKEKIGALVEEVRGMLNNTTDTLDKLHLIDVLRRLGIGYHFKAEIDETLSELFRSPLESDDLHVVAFQFRLLRQHRYNASPDVFEKFKDDKGKFKASLSGDAKGLLSLYEAAYYFMPGEEILDEAIAFTQPLLKSMVEKLEPTLKALVSSALEVPMARKMSRLETREYISIYQEDEQTRNDEILKLAKLDFYLLQMYYREEIRDICLWWKEVDLVKKLGYARDRIVECYFWTFGTYHEPQYSRARVLMGKLIGYVSMCDDTFDVYGAPDELEKFTDAIKRWEPEAEAELPEYMKPLYHAIVKLFKGVEDDLAPAGKAYRMYYVREAFKKLITNYLTESKWRDGGYTPTLEEHMRVSLFTSTHPLLTNVSYVGLGEEATKEIFEWLANFPKVLEVSAMTGRLSDDIVSHEFEQKRNHVASTVECYMTQYGVPAEEACRQLQEMIEGAWKTLNKEYLERTEIPTSVIMPMINFARIILAFYKYIDGYTNSNTLMKEKVDMILVDLIPID